MWIRKNASRRTTFLVGVCTGIGFCLLALAVNSGIFWQESGKEPNVVFDTPASFAPIAEKLNPAVVTVYTTRLASPTFQFGPGKFFFTPGPRVEKGSGSGFIITSDGYIITNYHVIKEADEIKVAIGVEEKKKYKAQRIGFDEKTDVALIKIDAENLPTVVLGDSDRVRVGDWVVAIGSPFNFSHTLTAGVVSAKGRRLVGPYDDFIQTDVAINPGNSGGPLVDMRGEVIGITSVIISPYIFPGAQAGNIGIGFAIPINLVKKILLDLKEKGKVVRPWLGVQIQPVSAELAESFGLAEEKGALVSQVYNGHPAEKAGIKEGDIILELNGKQVLDSDQLPIMIANYHPGDKVQLKIFREGKIVEKSVILGTMPSDEELARLGMGALGEENILKVKVSELSSERAEELGYQGLQGVVVIWVSPDSPLSGIVQPDDLIIKIDNYKITSVQDFNRVVKKLKPGQMIRIYYRRGYSSMFWAFRLPKE